MSSALASRADALQHLKRDFPTFSATRLVSGMQKVTHTVMAEGAVVITRHDEPAMVLLSVERYLRLEQAAEPQLDALGRQFDHMLERMQGARAAQAMADAFAMSPEELGEAAVRAAQDARTAR